MNKFINTGKWLQNISLDMVNRFIKGETVIDVLKPFIICSQILLLTPYKFTIKSGEYVVLYSKPLLLQMTLMMSLFVHCLYVVISTKETVVGHFHGTILFKIGDLFRIYSNLFTVIVIISGVFINKCLFSVIMTILSDIDKKFTLLSVDKPYERIKYKPFIGLLAVYFTFILTFIINDILANSWDNSPTLYLWIVLYMPSSVASFYISLYCTIILFLIFNAKMLNGEVLKMIKLMQNPHTNNIYNIEQKLITEIKKNMVLKTNKDLQLERITILWTVYDAICDGVSNLNRLFGLRILTIIGVSFISLVFNGFFVWSVYMNIMQGENTMKNYTFLIYCLPEIFVRIANITIVVSFCNSLKKQVKGF